MQTGAAAVLLQNLFWAAHCSALLHTLHLGPRHKIHWADVTKISEFWPDRSRGDGAACVLQCCSGCKLSSARLASQLAGLQSAAAAVVLQSRCSPAHMQPAACSSPGPGTRPNCTNAAENVQCPQCRARGSAGWRGRAAAGPDVALRNCSLETPRASLIPASWPSYPLGPASPQLDLVTMSSCRPWPVLQLLQLLQCPRPRPAAARSLHTGHCGPGTVQGQQDLICSSIG